MKKFLFGLLVGVALTVVGLDWWGRRLEISRVEAAQPHLARALSSIVPSADPRQFERFARPWFPESSGKTHGDWQVRSLDGKRFSLRNLEGKAVFLSFWGTGCGPCIAEMPGIERLASSLKNDNVAFVIATNDDEASVRKFVNERKPTLPMFLYDENLPDDLEVQGIPTTYLLNRNSATVFRHVGPLNWDDDGAREYLRALAKTK